jgi:hypothetical protein
MPSSPQRIILLEILLAYATDLPTDTAAIKDTPAKPGNNEGPHR